MLLTTEKPIIINNPEYKFETVLFLPPNPERRAEGGLRTKGLFKHSYKLVKSECECVSESESSHSLSHTWYICDTDGNPVKPAPDDIQQKILEYVKTSPLTSHISPSLKELPLITIITVVYNGAKYLEQTIQSVINQTYPNVEYIIIDGGSTDGTLDIIRKYEDYIDYWVSEPDEGMYDALNKGFRTALGNIFTWLNSDDIVYFYTLAIVYKVLTENTKVKWLTGIHSHINSLGELIWVGHPRYYFRSFIRKGYYRGDYLGFIQQEGTFFTCDLFKKFYFDKNLKLAGDYKLWIDFAGSEKLYTVKTILASFRIHGQQKSSNIKEYYKECREVSRGFKIWFLKYIFKPLSILLDYKLIKIEV
jgi:glycosyltransferase involved in cell wall biosynthesis